MSMETGHAIAQLLGSDVRIAVAIHIDCGALIGNPPGASCLPQRASTASPR
jgi:hypothetical protein